MKKIPLAKFSDKGGTATAPPPTRIPLGDVQLDNPAPVKKPAVPEPKGVTPRADPPAKKTVEQMHKDQEERLNRLINGDDEPEPPKKEEPPKEEPPPKKEEPPKEEPEPPKKEGDEEEDLSFNKPPEGSSEASRETAAQKRAKENGQALETLKTEHQELQLELTRTREELELLRKTANGSQQYRETDFLRHPEVSPIHKQILEDRSSVAETQTVAGAGKIVINRYGDYMEKFLARKAEQDEAAAQAMDADLRRTIAEDFRTVYKEANGEGYDERDMELETKAFTRDMLQLLVRNAGKTVDIQHKLSTLAARAKEGMLAQNVEVYKFHETDISTALDSVAILPEAFIQENPHSVEATVASLVKQPAWKKEHDRDRALVLELLLGPKALEQKDIDGMSSGGIDVKDFQKKRQKVWLDKRKKAAVAITRALLISRLWEQTSRDAAAFADANGELDVISRGREKKEDPPAPPAPKKKATEFTSAIEDHLAEVEGRR